jgi:hypothetical protein
MKRKKNIFDKIGSLIPGYRGYQERESRRECDRQLREEIASKLSLIENKISLKIADASMSDLMGIEKCRKKINNLKDMIRYSPYGASSIFSNSEIKEEQLETIYQLDLDVLDTVDSIEMNVHSDNLSDLELLIEQTSNAISKRNQYLKS